MEKSRWSNTASWAKSTTRHGRNVVGVDYYTDDNGVLKNRLGIENAQRLQEAEAHFSIGRQVELERNPIAGSYDLAHLQRIHGHLFQDIYDWAGKLRTVDIAKGDTYFCRSDFIEAEAKRIFKALADDLPRLKDCNTAEFCEKVGYHLGEINMIHPFREGNGRAQRLLITQLSHACGRDIDWSLCTQKEMIEASIEAGRGSSNKMTDILLQAVSRVREKSWGGD